MSFISNYQSLLDTIAQYAHRADLDDFLGGFVQLAENRIYRELSAPEMGDTFSFTSTDAVTDLPGDFIRLRELSVVSGSAGGTYALNGVGRHAIARLRRTTGSPTAYSIQGRTIEMQPGGAGQDYEMFYIAKPAPLFFVSTNAVLTVYPSLFLYASLIELGAWTQDLEIASNATINYDRLLAQAVNDAEALRWGEAPMMSAL